MIRIQIYVFASKGMQAPHLNSKHQVFHQFEIHMHSFYIGSLLIQLAKNETTYLDPQG